ncbi:hypothetical protein PF002_g25134, partial [Phytophthora fragariae]
MGDTAFDPPGEGRQRHEKGEATALRSTAGPPISTLLSGGPHQAEESAADLGPQLPTLVTTPSDAQGGGDRVTRSQRDSYFFCLTLPRRLTLSGNLNCCYICGS